MKKKGTYLVPTLYLEDWMLAYGNLPPFYRQKMKDVIGVAKKNIRHAYESGVKIAMGTDAAVYPHGLNAHEIEVYVRDLGMPPMEAIQTATVNAADLMGWTDRTGSLDAGKWADVIAVDGDPLKDVKLLQNVQFVMKAGVVYRGQGAGQGAGQASH
jgi:imidazolonepropionase-like amidohydrolase